MSWDEERIAATVTRQFVLSHLQPDEQARLDHPLEFGDGLTDNTYLDWILQKARRLFLILVDLGLTDQIFGVIDDSWDDDDLPLPLDQVDRLKLTYERDEKVEKKFFQRQFHYLARSIRKGDHVNYQRMEVVPLELAEKRSLTLSHTDKVHLPGKPGSLLLRRRVFLGPSPDRMPEEEFLAGLDSMGSINHKHIQSLWASYTYHGDGYILMSPAHDSSLKSFLAVTPQSFKILQKQDRRVLVLNWLHCLAEGRSHRNITPSSVMLDASYQVFLADCSVFSRSAAAGGEKTGFDKTGYDYAAPEYALRPSASALAHTSVARPPSRYPSTRRSTFPADPQKADIFSLGTIFLEILSFFLKHSSKSFSSHRSAKNKTPGRGGGLPDASFHKNLSQVESWMTMLVKDASKKDDELFKGVPHILGLVQRMLSPDPAVRPAANEVKDRLYVILTNYCGMGKDGDSKVSIHCEQQTDVEQTTLSFNELRLASQRAAAEACARVAGVPIVEEKFNGGSRYGAILADSCLCWCVPLIYII
ncbi:kinase-like domain-containing protein [Xylogone sp. PMI_703]|nr:kinase-like domain-containing protein [Xylogone sp. PMI_703]